MRTIAQHSDRCPQARNELATGGRALKGGGTETAFRVWKKARGGAGRVLLGVLVVVLGAQLSPRIGGLGGGGSGGVAERAAPRTEPRPSSIAGLKSSADIRGEWRQNGSWLALPQPLTARRPSPASARSETLSVTADKPLGSKPAWQPPVMKRASL
ncbi:unnamed protein product [Lampetra fluviatilis]